MKGRKGNDSATKISTTERFVHVLARVSTCCSGLSSGVTRSQGRTFRRSTRRSCGTLLQESRVDRHVGQGFHYVSSPCSCRVGYHAHARLPCKLLQRWSPRHLFTPHSRSHWFTLAFAFVHICVHICSHLRSHLFTLQSAATFA